VLLICKLHMLSEFDEKKKEVLGSVFGWPYNRRRRKPQQDLISVGGSFSCHQGLYIEVK